MKSLPQWSATFLLATPFGAWALGLGDIELQSALNQPLRAEIDLTATPEELEGLRVALATRDTFERFNLDRPAWLSDLRFEIRQSGPGRYVVSVTSRQPIPDPFVTMLVEATWPRGRLLREYTVLLDPPVFSPDIGAAPPIRQAEAGAPASPQGGAIARRPEPSPPAAPASAGPATARAAAPAAAPTGSVTDGRYGPVEAAETLWSIATRIRPADVTVNQMMAALYEANPGAFDGNMNVLLRGATLTIPSRDALLARSPAEATALVRSQENAWGGRTGSGSSETAVAAASSTESQQGRLRLLPPSTESVIGASSAGQSASSGAGADDVARLEGEVARLTAELEQNRRLLELRNAELEALQARLADVGAQPVGAEPAASLPATTAGVDLESEQLFVDETPADSPLEDEVGAGTDESVEGAVASAAGAEDAERPAEAEASAAETPAPAPVAVPPARSSAPEPSLVSRVLGALSSPFLLIGLGIGAVLLTAVWYLRNRREDIEDVTGRWDALEAELEDAHRDTESRLEALDDGAHADEHAEPMPAAAGAARAASREEPPVGDIDDSMSSQTVINLDQGDALAEADFHMAYGLYDQAAELVQKALEAEPHRRDLRLKLLEVFFVWGNKDAFRDAARELKAEIGGLPDGDWDKVLIMGKQLCPDDELFAESAAPAEAVDVALEAEGTELDFAFDDKGAGSAVDGLDFDIAATGEHDVSELGLDAVDAGTSDDEIGLDNDDDMLAIGARTAAGLEAALFAGSDDDDDTGRHESGADDVTAALDDDASTTLADATDFAIDDSAATQETPTVESETTGFGEDWAAALGLEDTGTATALEVDSDDGAADGLAPTIETPTIEAAGPEAPTVETPTVETAWADSDAPTMESPWLDPNAAGDDAIDSDAPTMETPWASPESGDETLLVDSGSRWSDDGDAPTIDAAGPEAPTVETPALGLADTASTQHLREASGETTAMPTVEQTDLHSAPSDFTEEIDLEDLGLTVEDLSGLPDDLGVLPDGELGLGDTREQPKLDEDSLLSATGITEVAEDEAIEDIGTAVLGDRDATMLAPPIDDQLVHGSTEVLERDDALSSGDTSLLKMLEGDDVEQAATATDTGLDLDLDDLSAALSAGDTVEQPRSSVESDLFEDRGSTPVDLDVGYETIGSDDPTNTEDLGALDPHTMTEIGTKLDLARAYIDMGDPDGARSILEEVLDEGDAGQRREAQGLIDALAN